MHASAAEDVLIQNISGELTQKLHMLEHCVVRAVPLTKYGEILHSDDYIRKLVLLANEGSIYPGQDVRCQC